MKITAFLNVKPCRQQKLTGALEDCTVSLIMGENYGGRVNNHPEVGGRTYL
jgi:hypothetical protein